MTTFKYLAFSVLLAMSVSGANAQDFDKGLAAYTAGDYQSAFKDFLPLAEGGDARAQDIIGVMYSNGKGVIQSDAEAVKWYRLAADRGYSNAQINLGVMYQNGTGIIQSNVIAHMWYNISSANGDKYAAKYRASIAANMTREDISKAQAMAQECMSSGYKNCGD